MLTVLASLDGGTIAIRITPLRESLNDGSAGNPGRMVRQQVTDTGRHDLISIAIHRYGQLIGSKFSARTSSSQEGDAAIAVPAIIRMIRIACSMLLPSSKTKAERRGIPAYLSCTPEHSARIRSEWSKFPGLLPRVVSICSGATLLSWVDLRQSVDGEQGVIADTWLAIS